MTLHHYREEHGLDNPALTKVTVDETADSEDHDSELTEVKLGN